MTNYTALVITVAALGLLLSPEAAQAYVGPGLGAGALSAVAGVIGAILLGLFSIIYYPIKRLMRRRARTTSNAASAVGDAKKLKG